MPIMNINEHMPEMRNWIRFLERYTIRIDAMIMSDIHIENSPRYAIQSNVEICICNSSAIAMT